jgi:N-glycosylase/DNA lyase
MSREKIRSRLKDFKKLNEKQKFLELQFCLLTPQSNAQRCWSAVQELSKLKNPTLKQITKILSTRTRFHNTKAKRILEAPSTFQKIKPLLSNKNTLKLRNSIAKNVSGYGLKEASHFLRNIGLSNNKIAILDRHILRNMKIEKIKSPKHYLELEQKFLNHAKSINIPPDELDLLWWSRENGEVFK